MAVVLVLPICSTRLCVLAVLKYMPSLDPP